MGDRKRGPLEGALHLTHFISATREQLAHNTITQNNKKHGRTFAESLTTHNLARTHNSTASSHRITEDPPPTCMINFLKLCTDKTKLTPATTKAEQSQR